MAIIIVYVIIFCVVIWGYTKIIFPSLKDVYSGRKDRDKQKK